jgi:hypothetical protein
VRDRLDFGVPGDVAVLHNAVDRFRDDLAVPADDAGKWKFALFDGLRRQLDAASHHLQIDCGPIHRAQPAAVHSTAD